jgi:hypothetical protein
MTIKSLITDGNALLPPSPNGERERGGEKSFSEENSSIII